MKKYIFILGLLFGLSACGNKAENSFNPSKGDCVNVPNSQKNDYLIQTHCQMIKGEFQPIIPKKSWFS